MTRYLRLFALQFRTSAASAMAYRANFLIEGTMSLLWMGLTLLPLFVVFGERSELEGWDWPSALIVMAYFLGVRAVIEGTISPSLVDVLVGLVLFAAGVMATYALWMLCAAASF
ncbi:MAG TPA: hypothetical protein VIX73_34975, partial [Kofleriaceae bacterium]